MHFRRGYLALIAVPVLAIGLAACGGSSNSGGSSNASSSTPAQTGTGSNTVSTKTVSGVGSVLVDSKGNVLYTNNQDSGSKMACTAACQSIWPPLMAPSGGQPTSSDTGVQAKLGVSNGQVTFDGKPLYTFVSDSPGQASGNGVTDSFGGTSFTWTAAKAGGTSSTSGSTGAATTTSSTSSSGGSSGGYGY